MLTSSSPRHRARYTLAFALLLSLTMPLLPSSRALVRTSLASSRAVQTGDAQANRGAAANVQARESYGKLELTFEPNYGQTDEQVKFIAHGAGYTLFLTSNEAVFALQECERTSTNLSSRERIATNLSSSHSEPCLTRALRMRIDGANPQAESLGLDQQEGIVNYFIGNDPAKWHTNIPTFARVRYTEVYPGIDLVYYGQQRQLEYDFVVQPGADAARVA